MTKCSNSKYKQANNLKNVYKNLHGVIKAGKFRSIAIVKQKSFAIKLNLKRLSPFAKALNSRQSLKNFNCIRAFTTRSTERTDSQILFQYLYLDTVITVSENSAVGLTEANLYEIGRFFPRCALAVLPKPITSNIGKHALPYDFIVGFLLYKYTNNPTVYFVDSSQRKGNPSAIQGLKLTVNLDNKKQLIDLVRAVYLASESDPSGRFPGLPTA